MKYLKSFELLLEEDGGGDGSAGSTSASATPSSDGGGVAYTTKGSGMGAIQNATVSPIPGDPSGSIPGSGDVSVVLPQSTYSNNSGITGNKFTKMISSKLPAKILNKKSFMNKVNKVKDKFGVGKVMSYEQFMKSK